MMDACKNITNGDEKSDLSHLIIQYEETEKQLHEVKGTYNELKQIILQKQMNQGDLELSVTSSEPKRKSDVNKTNLTPQNSTKFHSRRAAVIKGSKTSLGKKDSRGSMKSRKSTTSMGFEKEVKNNLEHMYSLVDKVNRLNIESQAEQAFMALLNTC